MQTIKALSEKRTLNTDLFESYYANETDIPYYAVKEIVSDCQTQFRSDFWLAIKCIENDQNILNYCQEHLSKEKYNALSALIADIKRGNLHTGNCKFAMIHDLLKSAVNAPTTKPTLSKFDRIATSRLWGKPIAIGVMILAFVAAMIFAAPIMAVSSLIPTLLSGPLHNLLKSIGAPSMLDSLMAHFFLTYSALLSLCAVLSWALPLYSLLLKKSVTWRVWHLFLIPLWQNLVFREKVSVPS